MTGTENRQRLDTSDTYFFDGDRPVAQQVAQLTFGQNGMLEITLSDHSRREWPLDEIRRLPDVAGKSQYVFRWVKDPVARLVSPNPFVLKALPQPGKSSPPKGRGRLAAWALAAVVAVAVQIGFLVPLMADNLAGFIPPKGERALGEATLGHIQEALGGSNALPLRVCDASEGRDALNEMIARFDVADQLDQELTVLVMDHEMINAFALPGGFVVLFRGLINAANHPDQVAAVLAHELGHVISRDPTRHALRSAGSIGILGLLLGDFAGGAVVLLLANQLIAAQYSQAAETAADVFAHEVLHRAGVNPGALGDMFETLRQSHGESSGVAAHFLSHPALGDRIEAAERAVAEGADYSPVISDDAWQALRRICKDPV